MVFRILLPSARPTFRTSVIRRNLGFTNENFATKRGQLVELLRVIGIKDKRVLKSIRTVPRHEFVSKINYLSSYDNMALTVGVNGQRILIPQPQHLAEILEAAQIQLNDMVLEVGTGTGYSAAVMSNLAALIWTMEVHSKIHDDARDLLARLGHKNVIPLHAYGQYGYPESAPYDAIVVNVSTPDIPNELCQQLAVGGRMIVPVYDSAIGHDRIVKVVRTNKKGVNEFSQENIGFGKFLSLKTETDVDSGNHYNTPSLK